MRSKVHNTVSPNVLTIASSDNSGGAGIQMDLSAFSMLRVHGCSVTVGITAQNSRNFRSFADVAEETITAQLETILDDFKITAYKTGMLGNSRTVRLITDLLKNNDMPAGFVVDPVLSSTVSGDLENKNELVESLKNELIPRSALVTPNLTEAEALLGRPVEVCTEDDLLIALNALKELGARGVLLKGGVCSVSETGKITDWLIDENGAVHSFKSPYLDIGPVHGTGCMLSALITAHLGLGYTMYQAVSGAESILHDCLKHTETRGAGELRYFNTAEYGSWEMHRTRVYESLRTARSYLLEFLNPGLLPEVGINFGYAQPAARGASDICAFESRLTRSGSAVQSSGGLAFGASSHVARIILAAMKFDLRYRSAMNIRYSEDTISAVTELGLTTGTFDRKNEPEGEKTMEWGTVAVIEQIGAVPDIIYDKGSVGKEPMVRVIGQDPNEVIVKLKMLQDKLIMPKEHQ